MSTSTVSITANPTTSKRNLIFTGDEKSGASPMSNEIEVTKDLNGATKKPYRSRREGESVHSRWTMILRVFVKYLLLSVLLVGLGHMVRILDLDNVNVGRFGFYDNLDNRVAEVEVFVKAMQVQVDVVDRKVSKVEGKVVGMEGELDKLGGRMGSLEKFLSGNELLSKAEFDEFFEDYKKAKGDGDLDEVRAVAKEIVEKEMEKHAADGLGRVDYALASGGSFVTSHSEAASATTPKVSLWGFGSGGNGVHVDSGKMLSPSFGQPGDCFALKGSSGFVEIKLTKAIVPEAVTLEHAAKSVAYDRSSAPKDCRVSGWFRGQETDLARSAEKKFSLAEFTYDLEKSNAQTFEVSNSSVVGVVDMIRLDYTSNHGSLSHTCVYRFRVHGHEPDSVFP